MAEHILAEYQALVSRQVQLMQTLHALPKGYLSRKTINGKQYHYLQSRSGKQITSQFIKEPQVSGISAQLVIRKQLETEKQSVALRISELEQAGAMIGGSLAQKMRRIRLSSRMDTLTVSQRIRSLSFSDALVAVEGIPVSDETRQRQLAWQNGSISFDRLLTDTLKQYGFPAEVSNA